MALIKCSECGKEISDKASSCPNCGNPMNEKPQTIVVEEKKDGDSLCCPKCGSQNLHSEQKGFSGGKALAGAVATGGIGLLAGTIGSKKVIVTCLKCGAKTEAGKLVTLKEYRWNERMRKKQLAAPLPTKTPLGGIIVAALILLLTLLMIFF